MAAEYLRLLREAIEQGRRVQEPSVRPNRTLLTFQHAEERVYQIESMTVSASGVRHPPQWGVTTNGPQGGNWQWNWTVWG